MSGAQGTVRVEVRDGIGTLTLERTSHRNAMSRQMCLELTAGCAQLDADPEVTVVVLTGAGGDFCAGAGLDSFDEVLFDGADPAGADPAGTDPAGTGGSGEAGIDRLSEADAAIRAVRKPTVALVEGICMGGGWQLAAAADVLVASTTARIAITPAKLGIVYPRPGLERLVDRVGLDRAKYLLFTAAEVSPQQAERWGLVTVLLEAEGFAEEAAGLVTRMQPLSQFSAVTQKRLADGYAALGGGTVAGAGSGTGAGAPVTPADYAADWERSWAAFRTGEDLATGRAAFAAKQQPRFIWRLDG